MQKSSLPKSLWLFLLRFKVPVMWLANVQWSLRWFPYSSTRMPTHQAEGLTYYLRNQKLNQSLSTIWSSGHPPLHVTQDYRSWQVQGYHGVGGSQRGAKAIRKVRKNGFFFVCVETVIEGLMSIPVKISILSSKHYVSPGLTPSPEFYYQRKA